MITLWQDLVYGLRILARKPVFTLVAAFSLALGIGLNTAIFTLVNSILLQSLPYRDADRIVGIISVPPGHADQAGPVSVPDVFRFRERAHSFEALGAAVPNAADFGASENGMPAERIEGENATPGLFPALGIQPLMGRPFTEKEDEVDNTAPVILIGYRLWQRRFAGDRNIIGRDILINGRQTTIIGVLPPDFRFSYENADYLAPIVLNHFQLRGSVRFFTVAARLKRGITIAQAQSEMDSICAQLAHEFPQHDTDHGQPWTARVQPIRQALFGFISRPLMLLQGAVLFVLLIACANVAALLLARASSRHTEVAVRTALGASRGRIIRQFLTESVLLSAFGGVLGVALAWAAVRALVGMAPNWLPRLHAINIDASVLGFTLLVCLFTGMLFGIMPAIQGSRASFVESVKDATRGGTSGGARTRLRAALVTGQLALSLMLLVGAGLLIRSFLQIQGADLGCDPKGLLTFRFRFLEKQGGKPIGIYNNVPLWEMSPAPTTELVRVFDRLKSVPGVLSVGASIYPPICLNYPMNFTIEGRPTANPDDFSADFFPVTPNFFATIKIPMVRGRDFNDRDTVNAPWVAIVNQTMARRFFPNDNPIGKRIRVDLSAEDQYREIVAVVGDIPATHPQTRQDPAIFVPFVQKAAHVTGPNTGFHLELTYLLRTQGNPMSVLPAVRSAVAEIDRNRPLVDPRTEESYLAEQVEYPRYYSMLLGLFAAVATGLAGVGIYGAMAYAVEQRTREIGIRMALGAGGWDVLRLIFRQAVVVIGIGVVIGIAGAMALTRYISSEIWEVQASDPRTYVGVTVLLIAIALIACLAPTRRAVRVDPNDALRYE